MKEETLVELLERRFVTADGVIIWNEQVRGLIDGAINRASKNLVKPDVKFQLPSNKQMIDMAILFNDGILDKQKLSDMVAYGQFIVDRLYENGDITKPSSKEDGH